MDILDNLNERQQEAVFHTGSPLLILAGAGSGKTRVITTKIAYLVKKQGIPPHSILAVTFTNKAANEMRERVMDLAPEAERVMIRTFHSFGAWLLRRNSHVAGLSENFSIYDDTDKLALLKTIMGKDYQGKDIKNFAHCISRAKDKNLGPEDNLEEISFDDEFPEIYRMYQTKLEAIGNVDFGDLISRPVKMLQENPEVKARIQNRFRVIMVDEFQDSNGAQMELLKALYDGSNYICVVGDEDQSIYGFRGAEVQNIIQFPETFKDTKVVMLEQNYRSTSPILDVALHVVNHNQIRMGKKLWTDITGGEPVRIAMLPDQDQEVKFCASLLKDGNLAGTAILYRSNYQSRAFETYFSRIGIPYKVVGSLRFFEREEVKDVISWLGLLLNPRDEISFQRVVNKPTKGIGAKSIVKVLQAPGSNIVDKAANTLGALSKKARLGMEEFVLNHRRFTEYIESNGLSDLIKKIYTDTGFHDFYKEKDEANGSAKIMNLYELANAASVYPPGMEAVVQFLESSRLDSDSKEEPLEGSVTLITIHNTKGLEFDRVILTGLEDGLFPYLGDDLDSAEEEIEEERRLFYVGITRARKELFITSCRTRKTFGTFREQQPSRFLSEIPEDKVEILGQKQNPQEADFSEGDYVYNRDYGAGVVKKTWYNGNNLVVAVEFESGKLAQFLPKYTKLERI